MKGNLNIPKFPEELKLAAKKAALDLDISLRQFVIDAVKAKLAAKK